MLPELSGPRSLILESRCNAMAKKPAKKAAKKPKKKK